MRDNMEMKIYEVPPTPGKKGRPRFRTEAEREAHREHVQRRDAMRLAAQNAAENREKPFKIGERFKKP